MTSSKRQYVYRELFKSNIDSEDLHLIRLAAHYCQPVAGEFFRRQIEEKYGIKLGQMKRGWPKESKGT